MLRIALVMPKFSEGFSLDSIPLSLAYIGAVLVDAGYEVRGYNLQHDATPDFNDFDVVGISSVSAMIGDAAALAQLVKETSSAIVVLGGAHVSAVKDEVLRVYPQFDFAIHGEGEIPLLELLKELEKPGTERNFEEVSNLIYRHGDTELIAGSPVVISQKKWSPKKLDELPLPNKEIFDVSNYPDPVQAYGDIIGTRGCPFKCTNCKPGLDGTGTFRWRNPELIVDEMRYLKEHHGVTHFSFSDSELIGIKRRWNEGLTEALVESNLNITYSGNAYARNWDKELLTKFKDSGCVFLGIGVESGSQDVLDRIIIKGTNLDEVAELIDTAMDVGIPMGAWFMVGMPGETRENIDETFNYAKRLNAQIMEFNIATPWPDTGFYVTAKANNWLLSEVWADYNEKKKSYISTPYLSAEETVQEFENVIDKLINAGWSYEEGTNRMYNPNFLRNLVKMNLKRVLVRGINKSDFVKLGRFLKILWGGKRPSITEQRAQY